MNCKQGDLAIVVSSIVPHSPNIGKIVRCLEFIPANTTIRIPGRVTACDGWLTDVPLVQFNMLGIAHGQDNFAADKFLRPIRDNDGEDETLTWAGKPEAETITAERLAQYSQRSLK